MKGQYGAFDHAVSCFGSWWQGGEPWAGGRRLPVAPAGWRRPRAAHGRPTQTAMRHSTRCPADCALPPRPGLLTDQPLEEYQRIMHTFPQR